MFFNIPSEKERFELQHKIDVLNTLEEKVKFWMDDHLAKRKLWFSSDFLPADEKNDENSENVIQKLRERVKGIKDHARVSVAVNLLTEEGLPHFHRLISTYLGTESFWAKWNNMWTAEEDRHGAILRDYARDSRLFNFAAVEKLQYAYQEKGFNPDWDKDPYRVFVYTTLQERATQYSHRNTGAVIGDDEPMIKNILGNIAKDEAKHFNFYRRVFKSVLEIDPNNALQSALAIMPAIDMPGISMPNFRDMADVIRRAGIYGPWDYKKIVEEAIAHWEIETLTGLNEMGRAAQEKIMKIPARLQKVAEYLERRTVSKTFSFDIIHNRILAME
ncbi:MAG: acyl-ACP desaturase [Melioribacteraceae bacterium]|nr:MAG: acyl-ACP desaturase [Melioribacteraceae bacterium]